MEASWDSQSCWFSSATRQLVLKGAMMQLGCWGTGQALRELLSLQFFQGTSSEQMYSFFISPSLAALEPLPLGFPLDLVTSPRLFPFLTSLGLPFLRETYSPEYQSSSWLSTTFFFVLFLLLGADLLDFSSLAAEDLGCSSTRGRSVGSLLERLVTDFSYSSSWRLRDSASQASGSSFLLSSSSSIGQGTQSSSDRESLLPSWSCSGSWWGVSWWGCGPRERKTSGSSI